MFLGVTSEPRVWVHYGDDISLQRLRRLFANELTA